MYNEGIRTFTATELLAAARRVKLSATVGYVEYADKNDDFIGVTEEAAASGDPVSVKLCNCPGSVEIEAGELITANTVIYGMDDGKVGLTSSGTDKFGMSLEAASGDGAVIEAVIDKVA